jgi:23S rRNA-/tRNA-specific pseudouridylate synthase
MQNETDAREPEILYEDSDVLVINKPSGMMVHSDGRGDEGTVVSWFLSRLPAARGVGEPGWVRNAGSIPQEVGKYFGSEAKRNIANLNSSCNEPGARLGERFSEVNAERKSPPSGQHRYGGPGKSQEGGELERSGVVHRLDRETSGVMVLTKNQRAFEHLKAQFHDRLAKKEYRAFVYGTMKEKWGTVDRPIGRSAKDFRRRSAQRGAKGTLRDAVTDWELIGQNDAYAYLKVLPKTGRTHQIRVHLKAIGRPVVGDRLYAPESLLAGNNLGFTRLALHAHKLCIALPSGGEKEFIAPLPAEFETAATSLAR